MFQTVSRGVILAVGLMFFAAVAQAQQYAALVMDARTGKVIHAVNADTRVHPASLTKMMTLYIVFDQVRQGRLSLDQKITVSANAASRAAVAARAQDGAEDRAALPDPRGGDQVGQRRGHGHGRCDRRVRGGIRRG